MLSCNWSFIITRTCVALYPAECEGTHSSVYCHFITSAADISPLESHTPIKTQESSSVRLSPSTSLPIYGLQSHMSLYNPNCYLLCLNKSRRIFIGDQQKTVVYRCIQWSQTFLCKKKKNQQKLLRRIQHEFLVLKSQSRVYLKGTNLIFGQTTGCSYCEPQSSSVIWGEYMPTFIKIGSGFTDSMEIAL
jgi:hypothetical protein